MKRVIVLLLSLIFVASGARGVYALSEKEIIERIDALTQTVSKQQEEIRYLKQQLEAQEAAVKGAAEKKEAGDERVAAKEPEEKKKPDWTDRVKVGGDLRLRYEGIYNREQREADGSITDLPNRDQYRIRARIFVDGKVSDEVSAHFMLCTNQDENLEATTTNQSLTDDFNDKGIYLHRAYATYMPNWLQKFELTGGKFKNTFLHTDIMWDPDVNPEGVYERYQYQGWKNFQPFVHLGQMVVNEVKNETDDAALFIYQAGFDWNIGKVNWTLAGSYYDWANLENSEYLHAANYKSGGGNTFIQDGTTLQYAYDYNLWEGISHVKFKLGEIPTTLIFDYIVNTADNVPGDQDTAYYLGFDLGKAKKKGDWSIGYKYARIERDAVIGSMNDQDFYGANRKGHKVKFGYMILDRLRFDAAYFYTDPVTDWNPSDVTFSKNKEREHEDRVQTDLIFNF